MATHLTLPLGLTIATTCTFTFCFGHPAGGHPSVMHVDGHMLLDTTTHKWVAAQLHSNDESGL